MKIDYSGLSKASAGQTDRTEKIEKKEIKRNSVNQSIGAGSKDKVTFSGEAQLLAKAMAVLGEAPDLREEKIEELKSQIASSQYEIPYDELANKILIKLGLKP